MKTIALGRIIGALFALGLLANTGLAQDRYPSRPVKIIVPTSPGAVTDVLARGIGHALSETWGQPVIIDNRPGADELLGDELVARAAPDGYTLGIVSNAGITASPQLHRDVHYDPQRDFTPIFMLGEVTPVMVVPAKLPVRTVQDLIAFAKARPGELNFGSFGTGTYAHVAMEEFMQRTGIRLTHVPYKGATPAYLALVSAEIAVLIGNLGSAAPQEQAGNIRIIATAGARRSKFRPDLLTIAESGVSGFSTGAWWGLFGPAKLPQPVVAKIRQSVSRALGSPEIQTIYVTNTLEREDMTPEEFTRFIRDDTANWTRQIKAAGIALN